MNVLKNIIKIQNITINDIMDIWGGSQVGREFCFFSLPRKSSYVLLVSVAKLLNKLTKNKEIKKTLYC